MVLLRNDRQQALASLHAHGEELLQRYSNAGAREQLPAELRSAVSRIVAARGPLLDELAALAAIEGDLAQAGNVERATLAEAADAVSGWLGADVAPRLYDADRDWLQELKQAQTLDWTDAEASVLEKLNTHLQSALHALGDLT